MTDELILEHLPLVRAIAMQIKNSLPAFIDVEDLIGAGCVGLIEAASRHDARTGLFGAFARFRIRGEMLDLLRRNDHVSRGARDLDHRIERARRRLAQILGRSPDSAEVAAELGMSLAGFDRLGARLALMAPPVSLEGGKTCNDEGEYSPIDHADDRAAADRGALNRELSAHLKAARGRLSPREREVISAMYDEGREQCEVAAALGLGQSRVSQIHTSAMRKLHTSMKRRGYR